MTIEFKVELNEGQAEKLQTWQNAHKIIFGKFGNYVYSFEDTGVNTFLEIKSKLSEQSITFVI